MANVYSIQFEVMPSEGQTVVQLFDSIRRDIEGWVVDKYQRRWATPCTFPKQGDTRTPADQHTLSSTVHRTAMGVLEHLCWTHPAEQDPSLRWTTDVVIAHSTTRLQLSLQVGVSSVSYVVRPAWTPIGRPRVVAQMIGRHSCWMDAQPLLLNKQQVAAPDVECFVHETLQGARRSLPYVVVTHNPYSERPVADIDRMQDTLLGFAQVVVLDKWAAFRLTDIVGKSLSCFNGAVRVYWPGFTLDSNPLHHPLYLPSVLARHEGTSTPTDRHLFYFLARISALRYVEGEIIREVRKQIDAERSAELERIKLQLQTGRAAVDTVEQFKKENERLLGDLELLLDEAQKSQARAKQLEETNDDLRARLSTQEANWRVYQEYQKAEGSEAPQAVEAISEKEFESVVEALDQAENDFKADLLVCESATKSAKQSDFARPTDVYQALMAIREVGVQYIQAAESGQSLGGWAEHLRNRGFTHYSPTESDTVKNDYKKYGRHREFVWDGEKHKVYQHLDLGGGDTKNCLQIYFELETGKKRVVIAHCGRHLPIPRQRT